MDPRTPVEFYIAADEQQAHVIQIWLENAGLECSVSGGSLQGAAGDIPIGVPTAPRLVTSAENEERARQLVAEWEKTSRDSAAAPREDWQCMDCGELNAPSFDSCWNCLHTAG